MSSFPCVIVKYRLIAERATFQPDTDCIFFTKTLQTKDRLQLMPQNLLWCHQDSRSKLYW